MRIHEDENFGIIGEIVNCVHFLDTASKNNYELDSNKQKALIKNYIYKYCGNNLCYENLDCFLIDSGAGGGGVSTFADSLLKDWTDKDGRTRRGLIDTSFGVYAEPRYRKDYPNAIDGKLKLIEPKKNKNKMVENFVELMNAGVIKFPYDFKSEYIHLGKSDVDTLNFESNRIETKYQLTDEEILSLEEVTLMKEEITNIYKNENRDKTNVFYALAPDKATKMHDDRFYVAIMLGHRLYQLRRSIEIYQPKQDIITNVDVYRKLSRKFSLRGR